MPQVSCHKSHRRFAARGDRVGTGWAGPACAGITTYSPLAFYGAKEKGTNCTTGVIGFGGLGDMCVKIAKAMGNKVVVFSTRCWAAQLKAPVVELAVHIMMGSNAVASCLLHPGSSQCRIVVGGNHDGQCSAASTSHLSVGPTDK